MSMSFHSEDMSDEYGIKDREMMRLEKKALAALLEHWPKIHKAIRSDIQLAEAAEDIAALAELERIARSFKCATFDQSEITPEIRAKMNEGRRKAEQSEMNVYDASKDSDKCPTCGSVLSRVDYHGFGKRCTICNTIS